MKIKQNPDDQGRRFNSGFINEVREILVKAQPPCKPPHIISYFLSLGMFLSLYLYEQLMLILIGSLKDLFNTRTYEHNTLFLLDILCGTHG